MFELEKGSKKFICPNCLKKKFVRYLDIETKIYLHPRVGKCDREISCGYHYPPRDYFRDNPSQQNTCIHEKRIDFRQFKTKSQPASYIAHGMLGKTLSGYKNNQFVIFLRTLFPDEIVKELIHRFFIGTSAKWNGSTIFWQIDEQRKIRSGKIIPYDKNTGKRKGYITWAHKEYNLPDFNLSQCLFGLHQVINFPNAPVGIVESEKSAIIMTGLGLMENVLSDFLWMATGSLNMLKPELLEPLKTGIVALYPDLGKPKNNNKTPFEIWQSKLNDLKQVVKHINISDLLEKKGNDEQKRNGCDIADFVIDNLKLKNSSLAHLIGLNPMLKQLIAKFDLLNET